ncbi:hypothetical protein Aple_043590 [Acrocarpospora pleiomorpha]|uniref:Luciferase-like domain-containing protein n=1 Tax=Acrocarpospora pleiomorpha TaxID=90975 RepID=A0A5M3XQL7_9ACTN|nr:LLM class flavin-dependent oxidoreductase [Acrocarpospora pleiomorpha]GES21463.1 hypothetical protein Aple_043590 [Acrocarpospora pleiomorpha]
MTDHRFVVGLRLDDPAAPAEIAWHRRTALRAESAGFDFVLIDDAYAGGGHGVGLDPVMLAARIAAATSRIGVIAAATTTFAEPLVISSGLATLDHLSDGRAGWLVITSPTAAQAELHGAGTRPEAELWEEAGEVVDVVGRLWDSWEDDAVIRDVSTGRYLDRRRLHRVGYAGSAFSIEGPSITPRPPQGHPVVAVRADSGGDGVIAQADVIIIDVDPAAPIHTITRRVDEVVARSGRRRHLIRVLGELPAGGAEGVDRLAGSGALDGVILPVDGEPARRDSALPPRATLRERFGLARPANRYATGRSAAP